MRMETGFFFAFLKDKRLPYLKKISASSKLKKVRITNVLVIFLSVYPYLNHHARVWQPQNLHRLCRSQRGGKIKKGPLWRTREIWRGIFSSETSEPRGLTVFMTWVSWIMTPPPTSPKTTRSAWKPLRRRIRRSTSIPASNTVGNSLPLLPQWMTFSGLRWMRHLNVLIATLWQSGRNPTHVTTGMWRVGLQSLLSGQRTDVSGGAGFRPLKSVWNSPQWEDVAVLHVTGLSVHAPRQRNSTYIQTVRRSIYETRRPEHTHLPIRRYEQRPQGIPSRPRYMESCPDTDLLYATYMSTSTATWVKFTTASISCTQSHQLSDAIPGISIRNFAGHSFQLDSTHNFRLD